jgi:hypothetical protein
MDERTEVTGGGLPGCLEVSRAMSAVQTGVLPT